ncbi:MAG: LysM peptidoglycan-binding domain-containing protein [Anaerocolumna aminovalerica]|uniref:LysM peptidoglycan-binding domain-containing protein n=1 Tax=Anaerocolumna aminovalerica TaxID=1527 RepID=UPI001C0F2AFA|nr:LysM peptidoglycan-binding domain-containing protein [Anaerocolumna aminovalerica]MBU5330732.1 LysM peptidoglycan-binding domain-containing protein [Anaerocolumna aminovalerica]MDU6263303.1 LysM peptidoglycan-binding domain-containing protein [Anaerocolumna aminovalerica]
MIIHVVQPGETIYDIAADYNVSVTRLIEENGIINPENLVVGQTAVIAYPNSVYIAQEGDTLDTIAGAFGVTRMQLLRNNPFLSDRNNIYQGETIIISYETQGSVSINGYAYPFIDRNILRKTLPFLTYLTIFNFRTVTGGEIVGSDDTEIIQIAKDYGVAPLMSLSTLTYQGKSDVEAVNSILYDEEALEYHINNILSILRERGYYGLNISLVNLEQQNRLAYENFMTKLSSRIKAEGYVLFITITPRVILTSNEISFETVDYTVLGQVADFLQILSYGWGSSVGPPSATTPAFVTNTLLENAVTMIPPEKLYSGISVIGYNFESPYIIGISRANALTTDAAIELALLTGSTILFEERSQAPYYEYYTTSAGTQVRHTVWFSDARTIDSLVKFIPQFGIQGTGIWNIMNYFDQMWLVINSQYSINKVLPEH